MTIETKNDKHIHIKGLFTISTTEATSWNVRIRKAELPGKVMIGLFWGDREVATHCTFEDLEEFKKQIAAL